MSAKVQAEVLALLGELGVDRVIPGAAFRLEGAVAVDARQLLALLVDYRDLKRKHTPPPLPPPDPSDDIRVYVTDDIPRTEDEPKGPIDPYPRRIPR